MPSAALEIHGLPEAKARVNVLAERAEVTAPFLRAGGQIIRHGFQQQIETEGKHYGPGWAPLAEATLERKARENFPDKVMRQTGAMADRIGDFERITKTMAREGVGRDHIVRFHQTGTENEPRRQLLGIAKGDVGRIYSLARRWIDGRL